MSTIFVLPSLEPEKGGEVGGWGYAVSCVLVVGWGRGGGAEAHEACARACEVGVERLWRGLLVRVWRGAHPSRTIQLGTHRTGSP